jgi:IS4 transposase
MLSATDDPKKALAALYQKRWLIEVDFRDIKTTLGMNILSCKTPELCRKEIWTYFLANNLIRLLMSQATSHKQL